MTEEAEQGRIDLIGVGPGDAVRAALDDDKVDVGDQPGQPLTGLVERQHPVRVALDDLHYEDYGGGSYGRLAFSVPFSTIGRPRQEISGHPHSPGVA
jgi:hypothetical protein